MFPSALSAAGSPFLWACARPVEHAIGTRLGLPDVMEAKAEGNSGGRL